MYNYRAYYIQKEEKKEIMKIKDKIKFVDSKVIEITRRATSKILRRMEWGESRRGERKVWLILGYTLLIDILRSKLGSIIFICRFSCSHPFSFLFRRFFLTIPTALSYCCCRCLQIVCVCVGVSCCYCCNSLHGRRAGRLLGKE